MDVRFINPFISSVRNVFTTLFQLDVQFGKPSVKTEARHTHDVSAIIGLSGDVVGAVIVSFPKLSAIRIASAFAGTNLAESAEDFADAIGELANMISGGAKKDFEGLSLFISTPSVVIGSGHEVRSNRLTPRLVLPCSTPLGSFVVEVGMRKVARPDKEPMKAAAEALV